MKIVKKILIATRNKNKFPEIAKELSGLPFGLVNLNDISTLPKDYDVEENATTFKGNAIKKAKGFGQKAGIITLADDSGLCVDALGGKPGVYSARYAVGTDAVRFNKLLRELEGVPKYKRTARYICFVAIYNPKTKKVVTCDGTCEGLITTKPIGNGGFGFDPIFFSIDLNKTMAQATMEEKNSVSHRGKALRKAKIILEEELKSLIK